jgi:hypothetical protein
MSLTRYGYSNAISGFFEFPTANARRILPRHLEPVELHHGTAVFSLTAFEFTESEVGAYGELVMSVIVSPLVKPGERLPKSAFYPYLVATTTRASREHAIERWHLPHWMEDVRIGFTPGEGSLRVDVSTLDRAPVAEMTVFDHSWEPVSHLYQCFMKDDAGAFLANIVMEGQQSEHEDERGKLVLHDHPFNAALEVDEVYDVPFREMWMRAGVQTFDPLLQLQTA